MLKNTAWLERVLMGFRSALRDAPVDDEILVLSLVLGVFSFVTKPSG